MVAGVANPVSSGLRFARGLLDSKQALEEDFRSTDELDMVITSSSSCCICPDIPRELDDEVLRGLAGS